MKVPRCKVEDYAAESAQQREFGPWVSDFKMQLGELAVNAERPISAAWAKATLGRFEQPPFARIVRTFHTVNPGSTPPEAQRRFLSAEQAQLYGTPGYPEQYVTPRRWNEGYRWINATFPYAQRYYHDLIKRNLGTPISQRYVVVPFLCRVLAHLIGPEPRGADAGSSDSSGNRRLLLRGSNDRFNFDWVDILQGSSIVPHKSKIFHDIVALPNTTRRIVGLDMVDPTDPATIARLRAYPTPEEVLSGEWAMLHDALMQSDVDPAQLGFIQANLARKADIQRVLRQEGQFDYVSSIASWYQGSARHRRAKFTHITQDLLRKGGVAIILDFATRVQDGAYLTPRRVWTEMNGFVWHENRLYQALSFTNGRCRQGRVHRELLELAKDGPYGAEVAELVESNEGSRS